jgi:hypothetical protein
MSILGVSKFLSERETLNIRNILKTKSLSIIYPIIVKAPSKLLLNPDALKNRKIYFDERFGLGSRLLGGEENLFISDAIDAGLKIKFFPFYIVQHSYESTIKSFPKYHVVRIHVGGALDARLHVKMAIIKAFAITLKKLPYLLCHRKNPFRCLCERLSGVFYILNSKN